MARTTATRRSNAEDKLFGKASKTRDNKTARPEPAQAILVGAHGRYQVKSGRLGGEYVARAFPGASAKARGLIAEATGATEEAAIEALHDVIDARESRRVGERRKDSGSGGPVPSVEEYVEAIGQVALSKSQLAMLVAVAAAGEDGLTEKRMAELAGYKSHASVRRSFAGAGLLIAEALSIETASEDEPSGDPEGTALLGYRGEKRSEDDPGNWILHPELREALSAHT